MKVKQIFLVLIWLIFTPLVSGFSSASEEQHKSIPEVKLVSQSGPTDPLELEIFQDAYFAEQMYALHVPGVTFILVKDGDINIEDNHMN
jgi:hypothetical protein